MDITTKIVMIFVYILIIVCIFSIIKIVYSYFTMQHKMKSSDYDDELLNALQDALKTIDTDTRNTWMEEAVNRQPASEE